MVNCVQGEMSWRKELELELEERVGVGGERWSWRGEVELGFGERRVFLHQCC